MANKKRPYKNNLQKYRVWKGLLQTDISDATGISISEIRLIERNMVCPTDRTIKKLIDFFGISKEQLIYLDEG